MARSSVTERDLGWKKIKKSLAKLDGSFTKVGVMEGELHKDEDGGLAPAALIAAVHEFGAPAKKIPARSFIRSTYDEEREGLLAQLAAEKDAIFRGESTPRRSLAAVGALHASQVQKKIRSRIPPPLADATRAGRTGGVKKNQAPRSSLKTRRSSGAVPLIDTGQLIQSITHVEILGGSKP
ncbi:MAG TPA: hypothetical protein VFT43_09585 [Candidatus Polarisedimenticolia bacterium]|nr:hypothetical protein [Candidatus Polarisedimenticolia bacterium]